MFHFHFARDLCSPPLPTSCWWRSTCGNCFRNPNWNLLSLMPAELGTCSSWAGQEESQCILDPGAVLPCGAAVLAWIRPLEELTFSFLGHHSIYSKPWQCGTWHKLYVNPMTLRWFFFFLTTRLRTVFLKTHLLNPDKTRGFGITNRHRDNLERSQKFDCRGWSLQRCETLDNLQHFFFFFAWKRKFTIQDLACQYSSYKSGLEAARRCLKEAF